ncbi:MAG: hypothetical protein ACO22K_09695 [Woeseiaceae bacterium]|jgi:hypothetical protein
MGDRSLRQVEDPNCVRTEAADVQRVAVPHGAGRRIEPAVRLLQVVRYMAVGIDAENECV